MRILIFALAGMFSVVLARGAATQRVFVDRVEPYPYVLASSSLGRYYVRVSGVDVGPGSSVRAAVYETRWNANDSLLWAIEMPYAYPSEVFLADGGHYLARFHGGRAIEGATGQDTVLVFYKDGQTLKAHTISEFVSDPESMVIAGKPGFAEAKGQPRFRIGFRGGSEFLFNCDTGELAASIRGRTSG